MKQFYLSCLVLLLPLAARAQRLEAVGVAGTFNVNQTHAAQDRIEAGAFLIETQTDQGRGDDTGNRLSAYARLGVGGRGFFLQPELAYTKVLGNQYRITDYSQGPTRFPNTYYFSHWLRRWELAPLAGLHLGPRAYLLAGPVLTLNRREALDQPAGQYAYQELYQGLYQSVRRVQVLGQLGVGLRLWRFDLGLRYEHSLTPYSQRFRYQHASYAYRQHTEQFILSASFLLYHRSHQW